MRETTKALLKVGIFSLLLNCSVALPLLAQQLPTVTQENINVDTPKKAEILACKTVKKTLTNLNLTSAEKSLIKEGIDTYRGEFLGISSSYQSAQKQLFLATVTPSNNYAEDVALAHNILATVDQLRAVAKGDMFQEWAKELSPQTYLTLVRTHLNLLMCAQGRARFARRFLYKALTN